MARSGRDEAPAGSSLVPNRFASIGLHPETENPLLLGTTRITFPVAVI
jgi:hypothetical protein